MSFLQCVQKTDRLFIIWFYFDFVVNIVRGRLVAMAGGSPDHDQLTIGITVRHSETNLGLNINSTGSAQILPPQNTEDGSGTSPEWKGTTVYN